jgi:hypothetical protein
MRPPSLYGQLWGPFHLKLLNDRVRFANIVRVYLLPPPSRNDGPNPVQYSNDIAAGFCLLVRWTRKLDDAETCNNVAWELAKVRDIADSLAPAIVSTSA